MKASIDFKAITKLQEKISNLGDTALKQATINALTKSKEYANNQVEEAMNSSIYHFKKTKGSRATGNALKVAREVSNMPTELVGGFVFAYVGDSRMLSVHGSGCDYRIYASSCE